MIFCKETYNFKKPTNRSHPILCCLICCCTLQHPALNTATPCNTLQPVASPCNTLNLTSCSVGTWHPCAMLSTLQHTATHCNTLQNHESDVMQWASCIRVVCFPHCNTLKHPATTCNTLNLTSCSGQVAAVWYALQCPPAYICPKKTHICQKET